MTSSENDQPGNYIEVNGAQIYYEITGKGPPLVLVHAGICDRRMWDEQVAAFRDHFRVIRYDMRGYGSTPLPAEDFSHQADLYSLLQVLGIESAVLLGCSMGGRIVVDVALEHPDIVSALILVTASVSGYDFEAEAPPQWDEMVSALKAGDFSRAAELDCQIWVDGPQRNPEDVDLQVRERVIEMDLVALANESRQLGQEIRQPPAANRLGEIKVPTLIIAGKLDQPDLMQVAEAMHATLPDSEFIRMDGVAHLPNMEKPQEFNQLVMDFLVRKFDYR